MEFEGLRKRNHSINLTPLIDIVFLLLVFFMLTAHFVEDEVIEIALPQAESGSEISNTLTIISIDAQGKIKLDQQTVSLDQLEQRLTSTLQQKSEKWVTLRGDQNSKLQQTVTILDIARKAGASAVNIVTNQP